MKTLPFLVAAAFSAASPHAQVAVLPPGFAVDRVFDHIQGSAPKLVVIQNPIYGYGAMMAFLEGGTLAILRVTPWNAEVFGVHSGLEPDDRVRNLAFDVDGDAHLFIAVGFNGVSKVIEVRPNGTTAMCGVVGSAADPVSVRISITDSTAGYSPGAWMADLARGGGSELHRLRDGCMVERLANNVLPPGRTDLDADVTFDRGGAFQSLDSPAQNEDATRHRFER